MPELHIQRPESSRNDDLVLAVDWERFRPIQASLCNLLREGFGVTVRNGFVPRGTYLELRLEYPEPTFAPDGTRRTTPDDMLTQLYLDLQTVSESLERCEICPVTGCVRLPGTELPSLKGSSYVNVFGLLDKLADPKNPSIAPLTWYVDGDVQVLQLASKARIRAAQAQATLSRRRPDVDVQPSQPFSNQTDISSNNQKDENNENGRVIEEPTAPARKKSYTVSEVLGDGIFLDVTGKIVVVRKGRLPDVAPGETVHLHGYTVLGEGDVEAYDVSRVEISRSQQPTLV